MTFVHDQVLDEVARWLRAGQDVLLRGDVGSGRTTVLHAVAERLRVAGTAVVLLTGTVAARAIPLGAVHAHPVLTARAGLPEASAAVAEALGTRAGVVLLDDVHHLDDATLAAVAGVVAQRGSRVRVVASAPDGVTLRPAVAALLRAAATVPVPPLDVNRVALLLADQLGAQVEGGLASVVAGRSGGNARVALALAVAGREAGVVGRVDGRWSLTGSLVDGTGTPVVHALTAELSAEVRRGLETVAWFGLIDLEHARELLGDETLEELTSSGRLVVHVRDHVPTVAVRPPALARALRQEVAPVRADALRARAAALVGDAVAIEPRTTGARAPDTPTARGDGAVEELVTVLSESVHAQAALRLDSWQRRPGVAHALPLLRLRLLEDVATVDVDEIFARTGPGEDDDARLLGSYVLLRAQWAACSGRSVREALTLDPGPSGRLVLDDVDEPFLALLDAVYARPTRAVVGSLDDLAAPASLEDFATILRVQGAIEAGAPDRALDLLGGWRGSDRQRPLADQLDALRGDALTLVGQVPDAVTWARERRSEAYDRLSGFGVRLASRGLATALFAGGDEDGARSALSVVLRLGRCGPVQSPYDERIYGLAAVLHARRGELELARAMLDELDATPRPYVPALDVVRPWARMEVESAAKGEPVGGDELWAAGEEHADAGRLASAALCWALTPSRLDDARLARLEELHEATHLPLLGPAVRLHRALAHGAHDELLTAAGTLRTRGPLALVAVRTAQERARAVGAPPLGAADVDRLVGAHPGRSSRADDAELTRREAEIVALARDGLTNREIASRLFVSVRTVESHLYRAMQKLGVSQRSDLG